MFILMLSVEVNGGEIVVNNYCKIDIFCDLTIFYCIFIIRVNGNVFTYAGLKGLVDLCLNCGALTIA